MSESSITSWFDQNCFSFGDEDAIQLTTVNYSETTIGYIELQELSICCAAQLYYRFRPEYVLIECFGNVTAEAVSVLACIRLQIPFVPVSVREQHAGGRLISVVEELQKNARGNIVAICCCEDDRDPSLGVFYQANIHSILFCDKQGYLREELRVPSHLPDLKPDYDNLYILFTSGTSESKPKAVVGSHRSTLRRLQWFRDTFTSTPRIARRTKLTFVDGITELLSGLLINAMDSILVAMDPEIIEKEGLGVLLSLKPTQITLLPSQLTQLLLLPKEHLVSLQRVIISGEPCSESLFKEFCRILPHCQLLNLYGQTESAGDALFAILTDMESPVVDGVVAVGKPILPHIEVRHTDEGELILSGNLANSYLGQQEPFSAFRTGDVGFCRNGDWYVRGRVDDVAKINGVLTSPSEVEAAFQSVYGFTECAAVIEHGKLYLVSEKSFQGFSRENMKTFGLPWNLIPAELIVHKIPRNSGGAGKVNRRKVRDIVQKAIVEGGKSAKSTIYPLEVDAIIAQTLRLPYNWNHDLSFVELGGDSALAVTLLYRLRDRQLASQEVTATDILLCDSIAELKRFLNGEMSRKRPRRSQRLKPFLWTPRQQHTSSHWSIAFNACVDASAAQSELDDTFYIGCQGGVVQRICLEGNDCINHYVFENWMIQANCLTLQDKVIVCGHNREGHGLVASLSLDLREMLWDKKFDSPVKTTPVAIKDDIFIAVGTMVKLLRASNGDEVTSFVLDEDVTSVAKIGMDNLAVTFGRTCLIFEVEQKSAASRVSISKLISEEDGIGPLYKDILVIGSTFVLSDSYGRCHVIDEQRNVQSCQVSSFPLSAPSLLRNSNVLVGSYDGFLRCYHLSPQNLMEFEQWKFHVGGVIYGKPLAISDACCLVCSTAGDIILVKDGKEIWRQRINAEIWSSPVLIGENRVAFGARDSRLHIIDLGLVCTK